MTAGVATATLALGGGWLWLGRGNALSRIPRCPPARPHGAIGVIRGPEGTLVVLRIRRDGRESDVAITRKRVRH